MENQKKDKVKPPLDMIAYDEKQLLEGIDSTNLDFDLTDIKNDSGESVPGDFQAINPLHAFSISVEVNLKKLASDGFITPNFSNTFLSSSYRTIKRPILNNVLGKGASKVQNANLIMVTSSLPGEGKSFSAINLAMSMAMEQDKNVLLIDTDLNNPSHFKIFDIDKMPGLTDILLGDIENISDVLCSTNIPSLTLMSTGRSVDYTTELLASDAMLGFLKDISTRYKDRIIIFDSPPLLLTTEASVIAEQMGQVILVVEAEVTQKHEVKKSLDILSNEIILLLLNKQREKSSNGGYGYGYGYGYGRQ